MHAGEPDRRASLRRAARDRPHLLDERHHRRAELHPADRRRSRQLGHRLGAQLRGLRASRPASGSSRPTTPGRSSPARRSPSFDRIGALPHPGRHRQHRAAAAGDRAAAARGRGAHPVLRRLPGRVGGRARTSTCAARASSASSSRASPAAASRPSAPSSRTGWGAKVTEAMGIGDIGVSLWGECEAAGRDAPRRARLRPRRADRPRDGRRASSSKTAPPASSCSPISATAPRRCCASAPATTSRCGRARARAAARARGVRCIGRTDDMLIVRGVNVFPSAIREVVERVRARGQRPHPRQPARRRA